MFTSLTNVLRNITKKELFIGIAIIVLLIFTGIIILVFLNNPTVSPQDLTKPIKVNKNDVLIRPDSAPYEPDVLIIRYKEGHSYEQLIQEQNEKELKEIGMVLSEAGVIDQQRRYLDVSGALENYYTLKLKPGTDLRTAQEILHTSPYIDFAQPNYEYETLRTPNDPMYSQQWAMPKIQADKVWDTNTGSNSVVVAVIDTGITNTHPDMQPDIVQGPDLVSGGSSFTDQGGHGTHVAGIIGAVGDNNIGVTGLNWTVKLMAVKVCSTRICGNFDQGLVEAANLGADVANMSLGTLAPSVQTCTQSPSTQEAVNYAVANGVTVVVAAGNDGRDASVVTPASCENVITVGATDQNDQRAVWPRGFSSNWGSVVEIGAPGSDIVSTWPPAEYKSENGTSMAAPHVAGAAALLLSINPDLSPQQVKDCLVDNGDNIQTDQTLGGKRLNIYKAVQACGNLPGETQPPTQGVTHSPTPGITGQLTGTPMPTIPWPNGGGGGCYVPDFRAPSLSFIYSWIPFPGATSYKLQYGNRRGVSSDGGLQYPNLFNGEVTGKEQNPPPNVPMGDFLFYGVPIPQGYDTTEIYIAIKPNNRSAWFNTALIDLPGARCNPIPSGTLAITKSPTPRPTGFSSSRSTPSPIPTEVIQLYDCRERTETQTVNGKQIQISWLDCSPTQ